MNLLNPLGGIADTPVREAGLLSRIIGGMSITVLPFLRTRFGIRYFKLSDIVHALILVKLYQSVVQWFGLLDQGSLNLFPWFFWSFLALAVIHYVWIYQHERAWQQNKIDRPLHTMHHGDSWLYNIPQLEQGGFNERRQLRFIEPGIVLAIGALMRYLNIDHVTGTWLIMSAVALFIQNNRTIQRWIQRERDQQDAMIISRKLNQRMQPPQPSQQPGHVVRPYTPRQAHAGGSDHDEDTHDIEATVHAVMGEVVETAAYGLAAGFAVDAANDLFFGDDE